MSQDAKSQFSGEILPPSEAGKPSQEMFLPLNLPPGVQKMGLRQALLDQFEYWGLRRTTDAYRLALESGLETVKVVTEVYAAKRANEMEKERWNQIAYYREGAKLEAQAFVERAKFVLNQVEAERIEAEIRVASSKNRHKQLALIEAIESNNLEAEKVRSERHLAAERAGLSGSTESEAQRELKEADQKKKDYKEIMAKKEEYCKEFGGEANLPLWAVTMFQNLVDKLYR